MKKTLIVIALTLGVAGVAAAKQLPNQLDGSYANPTGHFPPGQNTGVTPPPSNNGNAFAYGQAVNGVVPGQNDACANSAACTPSALGLTPVSPNVPAP